MKGLYKNMVNTPHGNIGRVWKIADIFLILHIFPCISKFLWKICGVRCKTLRNYCWKLRDIWRSKQRHMIIQQVVFTRKNALCGWDNASKAFKMKGIKLAKKIIILSIVEPSRSTYSGWKRGLWIHDGGTGGPTNYKFPKILNVYLSSCVKIFILIFKHFTT